MKTLLAVLMFASVAGAQGVEINCGKYQHEEFQCTIESGKCSSVCIDDTRTVTEREWQELIAEIEKLKKRIAQLEHELKQEDRLKHEEVPMWNVWCAAGIQNACVACLTDKNGNPVCYPPAKGKAKQ